MKLTKEQIQEINVITGGEDHPCRFTLNGCGYHPITGESCSKGSNVIYHPVFWKLSRKQGAKVAELTGAKWVSCK